MAEPPLRSEVAAASALLGVAEDAPRDVVRAAYRRALFSVHPDHGGSSDQARKLIDAAELLDRSPVQTATEANPETQAVSPQTETQAETQTEPQTELFAWRVDDDTIAVALPAEETYLKLLEVAHRIGAVTYVDRQCGVLESLLRTKEGTTVSLLLTLQGRATGATDVFFTLEPIDAVRGALPTVFDVSELVAVMLDSDPDARRPG
jgi:hypothetical protein